MTERNIRLLIAYDGSGYSGWQRQKNDPTIQAMIEDRLAVMTGRPTTLHGAGRTDAGVHALGMVANFTTNSLVPCDGFLKGLNSMLPDDIRILQAAEVPADFHSRYSAAGKTYTYTFFTGAIQLPTERLYTAHFPGTFKDRLAAEALQHTHGTHDFTSFECSGSRDTSRDTGRGAVRTILRAALAPLPAKQNSWFFSFTGDGFLRHMIRNLVGTLMEVGSGRVTVEQFKTIMEGCDRRQAGPTAPACGLTLEQIHYRPLNRNDA